MTAVSTMPSHLLLNRKDDAASHSTRKSTQGASSAFASYGFGPISQSEMNAGPSGNKGLNGPARSAIPNLSWMTQMTVQSHQK